MQTKRDSFPDALRHFNDLPDSAFVRTPVVQGLTSWSRATVHRRVADGTLPAPCRLSPGVTAFRVGDLRRFLNGQGR
ncbi:helix-turn-helix transcriptional regulator [Georgfuchsia toluolica]|nr:AlpA family phage regulatory protein [Georgfuchsia toluolica]